VTLLKKSVTATAGGDDVISETTVWCVYRMNVLQCAGRVLKSCLIISSPSRPTSGASLCSFGNSSPTLNSRHIGPGRTKTSYRRSHSRVTVCHRRRYVNNLTVHTVATTTSTNPNPNPNHQHHLMALSLKTWLNRASRLFAVISLTFAMLVLSVMMMVLSNPQNLSLTAGVKRLDVSGVVCQP